MAQAAALVAIFIGLAIAAWRTRHWLPIGARPPQRRDPSFASAPIALDRESGAIRVKGSSLVLHCAMPKELFLSSDLYPHTKKARYLEMDSGQGYAFDVVFDDPQFSRIYLWLVFENDRLAKVQFGWGPPITTAQWTNEHVEAEVARYRQFLVDELGTGPGESGSSASAAFAVAGVTEFPWGKAWAVKDPKSGAPSTGVRYDAFKLR